MNSLLEAISNDLGIIPYYNEKIEQYVNRIIYSSISLWILTLSYSTSDNSRGISKSLQTVIARDTLSKYLNYGGVDQSYFILEGNRQRDSFVTHIRNIYEETGYLLADSNSYSVLLNSGNSVPVDDFFLYFGLPKEIDYMFGMGIYVKNAKKRDDIFKMMLRDHCSPEEYLNTKYNILDFTQRAIDLDDFTFFNPKLPRNPSSSWEQKMATDETVVGNQATRTYFRVINYEGTMFYAEESFGRNTDRLTGNETRRLFIALKHKYGYPVKAWINRIDDNYYRLKLSSHLPNREYYFLLLLSWPVKSAYDRNEFIIPKKTLSIIESILGNIGIDVRRNY